MAARALELAALVARFWFVFLIALLAYNAFRTTRREVKHQRVLREELAGAQKMGHIKYTGRNIRSIDRGQEWVFERESSVGSSPKCDIVLRHPSVLDHHARLFAVEGYLSCEPGPGAICAANGEEFTERTTLEDGDKISFGDLSFKVKLYDQPMELKEPRKRRRKMRARREEEA